MKLDALLLSLTLALGAGNLVAPAEASAKGHAPRDVFPMKAAEFRKKAEARIDRVRAVIDKKLDTHNVSAERKKAIHRIIDEAAKEVRDTLAQVSADGSVTESEANKVKALTIELRSKVRERMRAEKSGKGSKAKATDKSKAADKSKGGKPADKGGKPADKGGKAPAPAADPGKDG